VERKGGEPVARILIVDDSKYMRKTLADILLKEGHQVVGEAENGLEAENLYERLHPDLVTMDIIMPAVGGVDAISALEAIVKASPPATVVMISAMGQDEAISECRSAGCKGFIVKPFRAAQVVDTVNTVLEAAQSVPAATGSDT
jgi:two-component system chemotaxis response regulator CheY